jgi:hypothetical protein
MKIRKSIAEYPICLPSGASDLTKNTFNTNKIKVKSLKNYFASKPGEKE